MWEFLQAMTAAISSGKFDIVNFLKETCGEELYRWGTNDKYSCPLTRAIDCGPGGYCEVSVHKRIQSHFV
ncbi:hypothetical protein JG688_00012913 [Phytophthora aleatoria]|uniref:Uncharacterized protein n=1 Tax=Phytophthora aleatoria TaxID=2496075 RepID=A0A8J5MEK5_9STRA|nr:hypothetical protein JG688_00012913 [Phytophthora aleatoria]